MNDQLDPNASSNPFDSLQDLLSGIQKVKFGDLFADQNIRQNLEQMFGDIFKNADTIFKDMSDSFTDQMGRAGQSAHLLSNPIMQATKEGFAESEKHASAYFDSISGMAEKSSSGLVDAQGNAIKSSNQTRISINKAGLSQIEQMEKKFQSFITTKERKIYEDAKNWKNDLIKIRKAAYEAETKEIKDTIILKEKELQLAKDINLIESGAKPQLKKAEQKALASEGRLGLMPSMGMGIGKELKGLGKVLGSFGKIGGMLTMFLTKGNLLLGVVTFLIQAFMETAKQLKQMTELQVKVRAGGVYDINEDISKKTDALDKTLENLFKDVAVSPTERRELIGTVTSAPKAYEEFTETKEGPEKLKTLLGAYRSVGLSIADGAKLVATQSQKFGKTFDQMADTFKKSTQIMGVSRQTFGDAFNTVMGLEGEMRKFTFSASEAQKVLFLTSNTLSKIGFGQEDIKGFQKTMGSVIAGFSPSKLAGMSMFVQGTLPTLTDLKKMSGIGSEKEKEKWAEEGLKVGGGGMDLMLNFFNKAIKKAAPTDAAKEKKLPYILEKLAGQLGYQTDVKTLLGLEEILRRLNDKTLTAEGAMAEAEKKGIVTDAQLRDLSVKGWRALADTKGPLGTLKDSIEKLTSGIIGDLGLIHHMSNLTEILASPGKIKDKVVSGAKSVMWDTLLYGPMGPAVNVVKRLRKQYNADSTAEDSKGG